MVHVRALAGGLVEIACQYSCTGVGHGLAGGTQAEVTLVGGAGVGAGVSELQPAWLSVASWKIWSPGPSPVVIDSWFQATKTSLLARRSLRARFFCVKYELGRLSSWHYKSHTLRAPKDDANVASVH